NMRAYQSIWETVTQRELVYRKPRYASPILMDTANFAWAPVADGVYEKLCGVFTERRASASLVKLDPGATHQVSGRGIYFVLSGEGRAVEQRFSSFTTVFLDAGERAALTATTTTEILHYGLPDLASLTDAAFAPARVAAE